MELNNYKRHIFIAIVLTLFFVGCGNKEQTVLITDLERYRDLKPDPICISVNYSDAESGEFDITDETTIQEIMTILLEKTEFVKKDEVAAGNNGVMVLSYEDGTKYRISLYRLSDSNGESYYYTSSELLDYLYNIGKENGSLTLKGL